MQLDFEKEYYIQQIEMMSKRYSILFKKWKINWNKFNEYFTNFLKDNYYWIWSFLCGFENVIKHCQLLSNKTEIEEYIYKSSEDRLWKFVKKENSIKNYLNSM